MDAPSEVTASEPRAHANHSRSGWAMLERDRLAHWFRPGGDSACERASNLYGVVLWFAAGTQPSDDQRCAACDRATQPTGRRGSGSHATCGPSSPATIPAP